MPFFSYGKKSRKTAVLFLVRLLAVDGTGGRFAGPLKGVQVDIPAVFQGRRHPVDKVGRGGSRGLVAAGEKEEAEASEGEGVGQFLSVV